MKIKHRIALISTGLAAMLFGSNVAAQELDASGRAVIEAEARHHVDTYYNYFYERNMTPLPVEIFNIPWILLGSGGLQVTETAEEAQRSFDQSLASLLERDWDRSIWTTKSVCVLNAGSAIVSGTNTRTKVDGGIMSVGGVTYFLGKTDDGWRIISYAGHAPDQVVSC